MNVSLLCGKDFLFCEISLYGCSFVCTSHFGLILVHAKEAKTSYFIAIKEVFVLVERFSGLCSSARLHYVDAVLFLQVILV